MASDPCLTCGGKVDHRDSLYVTQFPGTQRNKAFVFCDWDHLSMWMTGVTPEVWQRFKRWIAEAEEREPIPDDFSVIRERLAELRGGPPMTSPLPVLSDPEVNP